MAGELFHSEFFILCSLFFIQSFQEAGIGRLAFLSRVLITPCHSAALTQVHRSSILWPLPVYRGAEVQ
jgi:hypothetical protein